MYLKSVEDLMSDIIEKECEVVKARAAISIWYRRQIRGVFRDRIGKICTKGSRFRIGRSVFVFQEFRSIENLSLYYCEGISMVEVKKVLRSGRLSKRIYSLTYEDVEKIAVVK